MLLHFTKMHSLGVDFMVVDLVGQHAYVQPRYIQQWSNRYSGIGFERLIVVEVPSRPDVDFRCRVYTADGVEVAASTQEIRCVLRFAIDKRLTLKQRLQIENNNHLFAAQLRTDGLIEVELAPTSFQLEAEQQRMQWLAQEYVLQLQQTTNSLGLKIDLTEQQQVISSSYLQLETETYAYHSYAEVMDWSAMADAACVGALYAAHLQKLQMPLLIEGRQGELQVNWQGGASPVTVVAQAARVYEGKIKL